MGDYRHKDFDNRRKAKRLLDVVWPRARELAASFNDMSMEALTMTAHDVFAHLTEENVEGLHVYRAPFGGWHADIVLKKVPLGVPKILGTPSATPCETREAAIDAGASMLASVVAKPKITGSVPAPDEGMVPFEIDDVVVQIPRAALEKMREAIGEPPEGYAEGRLAEFGKELPGVGPFSQKRLGKFSKDDMARFHAVICVAILSSIHRWPLPEHAPPRSMYNDALSQAIPATMTDPDTDGSGQDDEGNQGQGRPAKRRGRSRGDSLQGRPEGHPRPR